MNHLATMRIHDSSIDSWDARRVRKRRRVFHVQKLRGRLSLPPESAKQDISRGTRHGVRVCLHMFIDGTHRLFPRAYDSRNIAPSKAKVRAIYA
jgi:hypothetical protein